MSHKIEFIVTARPSWARVKSLFHETKKILGNSEVCLTTIGPINSEKFGSTKEFAELNVIWNSFSTLSESTKLSGISLNSSAGSEALARLWENKRPKAILVIADRTETLGVTSSAALMQIPIVHLQGGEVSGSIDDKIRDANSKLADIHLTTNNESRLQLLKLGESNNNIFIIGCPSIDLVKKVMANQSKYSTEATKLIELLGVGDSIQTDKDFGIIMFHPDTLNLVDLESWIYEIVKFINRSKIQWMWFWPNADFGSYEISKLIRRLREIENLKGCRFFKNVPPEIFIQLASKARIMVGNSSFGIREASFLGLPVLNLGARQNKRLRGENVTDIYMSKDLNNLHIDELEKKYTPSDLYGAGNAGYLGAQVLAKWDPKIKTRED
jgi:UDP-hydrolysing UDP-N-acetyl-D-glucosamine 2-epimerase